METIRLVYPVEGGDLIEAGEASSKMKLTLKKLGLPQDVIRRASICMYEGETKADTAKYFVMRNLMSIARPRWRWTPIRLLSA